MSPQDEGNNKRTIALSKLGPRTRKRADAEVIVTGEVRHGDYRIRELESGSIEVLTPSGKVDVVKPVLTDICRELGLPVVNGNGNPMNTRQLGYMVIRHLSAPTGE